MGIELQEYSKNSGPELISGDDREQMWEAGEAFEAVQHSVAYHQHFDNVLPNQSGRVSFNREDYEHFRPAEAMPRKYSDVVKGIDNVYSSLSIVRNMIDLMSDFACEGISVVHPVPSVQKFYEDWFSKVNGQDRSERFLSGLYRHGMVVVTSSKGQVKSRKIDKLELSTAELKLVKQRAQKNRIPLQYSFKNPAYFTHENFHEPLERPQYSFRKPIKYYSNELFKSSYDSGEKITLDPDRTYVDYYKKDDWEPKPRPFLYPVIRHAMMIEKLTLADASALDGAISKVRIFKLGDKDKNLFPNPALTRQLGDMLRSNTGSGTIDIVWGPNIDLIESDTDIYKFLGDEKYIPHLTQVYEGLGIPASFAGVGQGTTNNYITLKILLRRLMSGREKLIKFWTSQMKQVQLAMGFAKPASLEFNHLDLGDEESERQLLIQLLDRNLVSEERVQKILGFDPRIENKRISRESKDRARGRRPEKAGQFHNGEKDFTLTKIAVDRGYWAPEHSGIKREEGTEDIVSPFEFRMSDDSSRESKKPDEKDAGNKGGGGGRPPGSKDTVKRKTPTFSPKIKASMAIWASQSMAFIHSVLKEKMLVYSGKKNMREFSAADTESFELLKFSVLFSVDPFTKLDESVIGAVLEAGFGPEIDIALAELDKTLEEVEDITKSQLALDDVREIQKSLYIQYHENNKAF